METAIFIILGLALGIIGAFVVLRLIATSAQSKPFFRRREPENGGTRLSRLDESLNGLPGNRQGAATNANYEIGGDLGLNDHDYLGKSTHKWTPLENSPDKSAKPAPTAFSNHGQNWAPSASKLADARPAKTRLPVQPVLHPQTCYPGELPEGYGDNRITLLARDPEWIFAYWETSSAKIHEVCRRFGVHAWEKGQHVLRVYDTTDLLFDGYNANHYFDIQISRFSRQWHVEVGRANRTYCIDRGLIIDNHFIVLARSNFVTTPANCVSSLIDEQWMLLNEYDRKLYQRLDQPLGGSSPHFAYSVSLAEELAKMGMGVSSPFIQRPK